MINAAAKRRQDILLPPLSLGAGAHGARGGFGAAGNDADLLAELGGSVEICRARNNGRRDQTLWQAMGDFRRFARQGAYDGRIDSRNRAPPWEMGITTRSGIFFGIGRLNLKNPCDRNMQSSTAPSRAGDVRVAYVV